MFWKSKKKKRLADLKNCLDILKNCLDISIRPGNWNYNDYQNGFTNGLILAWAILHDEDPKYLFLHGEEKYLEQEENDTITTSTAADSI